MLSIPTTDPSPLIQAGLYMAAILAGYGLLTTRDEWERARAVLREALNSSRRRE